MGSMVLDYETPVVEHPYQPPRETPGTPARISEPPRRVPEGTATIEASEEPGKTGGVTPIERELRNGQKSTAVKQARVITDHASVAPGAAPATEVDRVAAQRATLLAKRYETRHLSREQETRLEMLNERLKVLLPPVTEAELQLLEQMALQVKRATERVAEIKRRFDLG
jgi:hypothetical protein